MPMTTKTAKWKRKVEFEYGGRSFSENRNSNILDVLIDFDVLNCDTSPRRKPKVDLRRCGRHLENGYDVITGPRMVRFGSSLVCRRRITCQ